MKTHTHEKYLKVRARLLELLNKTEEHTEDEEWEEEELMRFCYEMRELNIITPVCCENARTWVMTKVWVRTYGPDYEMVDPSEWVVKWSTPEALHRPPYEYKSKKQKPEPKCCVWCGTDLPSLRKKDPAPEFVRIVTPQEDCGCCKQDLDYCVCHSLEHAWEIVPENPLETKP